MKSIPAMFVVLAGKELGGRLNSLGCIPDWSELTDANLQVGTFLLLDRVSQGRGRLRRAQRKSGNEYSTFFLHSFACSQNLTNLAVKL